MKKDILAGHLSEVEQRMRKTAFSAPAWRAAYKKGYSFSALPFEEQLEIWSYIWKNAGNGYWTRIQPVFFCETFMTKKEKLVASWETLRHWQDDVDHWGYCDSLSKIYTKTLELLPAEVYAQLVKWNTDKDLWKRRQSLVSLLYYSRTKKIVLPYGDIIRLIDPLLEDEEYYVQKGVGWALREVNNVYPKETGKFLDQHIRRISAIAFTAATEKIDAAVKEKLKQKRK